MTNNSFKANKTKTKSSRLKRYKNKRVSKKNKINKHIKSMKGGDRHPNFETVYTDGPNSNIKGFKNVRINVLPNCVAGIGEYIDKFNSVLDVIQEESLPQNQVNIPPMVPVGGPRRQPRPVVQPITAYSPPVKRMIDMLGKLQDFFKDLSEEQGESCEQMNQTVNLIEKFGDRDSIGVIKISSEHQTHVEKKNLHCLRTTTSEHITCDIMLTIPVPNNPENIDDDKKIIQNIVFGKDIDQTVKVIYKYLDNPIMIVEVFYFGPIMGGMMGSDFGLNITLAPLISLEDVNPTLITLKEEIFPEDYTLTPLKTVIISDSDTKPARAIPLSQ